MTASSNGLRLTTVWIWSVRRWWDGGSVFVRLLLTSYIHLSSSMRDNNTWDVWPVMTRLSLWHGVMAPRQREEPVVASRCIRFLEVNNGLIGGVRLGFVKDGDVYDLYISLVYFKWFGLEKIINQTNFQVRFRDTGSLHLLSYIIVNPTQSHVYVFFRAKILLDVWGQDTSCWIPWFFRSWVKKLLLKNSFPSSHWNFMIKKWSSSLIESPQGFESRQIQRINLIWVFTDSSM